MKYLILILIIPFLNCKTITMNHPNETRSVLIEFVNEKHIKNFIQSFHSNYIIRINDLSGFFSSKTCSYQLYTIKVENKINVDLNSGRFIDISVLSFKKDRNLLNFEVFYSKRSPNCDRDFLMLGNIIMEKTEKGYLLKNSKFEAID